MNMFFTFSTKYFDGAKKINNIYLKGNFYNLNNEEIFFMKATVYKKEKRIEEYFQEFIKNKELFVKSIFGDFILFYYNAKNNYIFFATDRLGKEIGLYYFDGKDLIITNSFWDGIRVISPKKEDINVQNMKEIIVHGRALLHDTIINNYKFLHPANYMEVKLKNNIKIKTKKYWHFKFSVNNSLTIDEIIERIESSFNSTFKMLKEKYSEKTKFGVGLSGGLDSRLIAHYAKKYKLRLVPYCIGEKYYFYPIKTNGYNVAKKIANYFNLTNFKFINYNSESTFNKIYYDIYYAPYLGSAFEIAPLAIIPDFDIMLNGEHGGVFFGEFDFRPLLNYSKSTIHKYLLQFLCHYQFKNYVMNKDEETIALNKVKNYVSKINSNDRYEIFYQFFFEIYGSKSRRGFFESNYGLKKSYSQFLNPNFFDYFLSWDSKFLIDRILQRALFTKYFTALSKIPDETYDAPIYWRDNSQKTWPLRFYYASLNYIKKPAIRRKHWIINDNKFKRLALKTLYRNNEFIKHYFPNMNYNLYMKSNPRAATTFIKMNIILDIIVNNGYKDIKKFMENNYR